MAWSIGRWCGVRGRGGSATAPWCLGSGGDFGLAFSAFSPFVRENDDAAALGVGRGLERAFSPKRADLVAGLVAVDVGAAASLVKDFAVWRDLEALEGALM